MIIERLQTIISHYGLTSSSLADSIGVPRSRISHLLSGRNKPSLDFVLKLVKIYPEIDLYWLLKGKGEFPSNDNQSNPNIDTLAHNLEPTKGNIQQKVNPSITTKTQGKSIQKIVVLYEDGTFESYSPNS